jgi:ribosome biogenesis SPOUT family RNA methylase Rps3
MTSTSNQKVYIVEHLDPELEQWSALEYKTIAAESQDAGALFYLSSVPPNLNVPAGFRENRGLQIEQRGVEDLFAHKKERVCLLDPAAKQELVPEDGEKFDVFLFGGILGDDPPRGLRKSSSG